jgi:ArsR family transcriptional regulator
MAKTRDLLVTSQACCAPLLAEPIDESEAAQLARKFAALADPARLLILNLVASGGEICSCDLEEPLGRSQPTISHHTKILAEAGLIAGTKQGRWMMWRLVPEEVEQLRGALRSSR